MFPTILVLTEGNKFNLTHPCILYFYKTIEKHIYIYIYKQRRYASIKGIQTQDIEKQARKSKYPLQNYHMKRVTIENQNTMKSI